MVAGGSGWSFGKLAAATAGPTGFGGKRCPAGVALLVLAPLSQFDWAQTPQEDIAVQVLAALKILDGYHTVKPVPLRRTLHMVYWTPQDRDPAPQYHERLTRVLIDIRTS